LHGMLFQQGKAQKNPASSGIFQFGLRLI